MSPDPKPLWGVALDPRVCLCIARHHEAQAKGKQGRAAARRREEAKRMREIAVALMAARPQDRATET